MSIEVPNKVRMKNEPICDDSRSISQTREKATLSSNQPNKITKAEQSKPISNSKRIREDISSDDKPNKRKRQSILVKEEPTDIEIKTKVEVKAEELPKKRSIQTASIAFLNKETITNQPKSKRYECDICKQSFTRSSSLATHRKIHTGEKPYECEICQKRFNQSGALSTHRRTHTGERPFECDICKKSFAHKHILVNHRRVHTGERPFECDVCQKSFTQSFNLEQHRKIHTGEKPYECEICEKRFIQSISLVIHRRTHTGEKPYECEICKKSFNHSSHLLRHRRTHTGEKTKNN